MVGDFLYFFDGNAIKINVKSKDSDIVNYVSTEMNNRTASKEVEKIYNTLNYGDSLVINDVLRIYRNNKIIYTLGGKNKYWIYMRFI